MVLIKLDHLAWLICPDCKADLLSKKHLMAGDELLEGELICPKCDMVYDVTRGIPNMLPRAFRTRKLRFDETFGETPPDRSLAGIGKGACAQVRKCQTVHRFEWLKMTARGRVLDIGGNEGSGWSMPMPQGFPAISRMIKMRNGMPKAIDMPPNIQDIYLFDCDFWSAPFEGYRGDAHRLPFRDATFDTVVLSDILEHVEDDYGVLAEAARVARLQVIGTTPDEYGWDQELQPFKPIQEWITEKGGSYEDLQRSETTGLKTDYAICRDYIDDRIIPHLHHVRWYDYAKVTKLLGSLGKRYELTHIHYHGDPPKFTNYGFVMEA